MPRPRAINRATTNRDATPSPGRSDGGGGGDWGSAWSCFDLARNRADGIYRHRLGPAPDLDLAAELHWFGRLRGQVGRFAHEDAREELFVHSLEAGSDVDHVAEHAVLIALAAAHEAHHRIAGVEA